jgi:hypothetical protein
MPAPAFVAAEVAGKLTVPFHPFGGIHLRLSACAKLTR